MAVKTHVTALQTDISVTTYRFKCHVWYNTSNISSQWHCYDRLQCLQQLVSNVHSIWEEFFDRTSQVFEISVLFHITLCVIQLWDFGETFSSATDHKKSHKHAAGREKNVISPFNDSLLGNSLSIKIIPITEAELHCTIQSFKPNKQYQVMIK
jgi:hypothetical protein